MFPDDILVNIEFHLGEARGEGGELYWTVNDWAYSSEVLGGAHFMFKNLFNGNKPLCKYKT